MALCQSLPGPASSQFLFEVGRRRAGLAGALLAAACFTLPSASLMLALAMHLNAQAMLEHAGIIHGFKLAAVGVVAQALLAMSPRLCPDGPRTLLACASCAAALWWRQAWTQPLIILAAGVLGLLSASAPTLISPASTTANTPAPPLRQSLRSAWLLLVFAAFFLFPKLLPALSAWPLAERLSALYQSGALVFGGGHVVLPLLERRVVDPGWVSNDQFLAGYAAAQTLPGPLFAFGAYLGVLIGPPDRPITSALAGLVALFLPGWLLIAALGPAWAWLKHRYGMRRVLAAVNAAVVGLLAAALYDPLAITSVHTWVDAAIALGAFAALAWKRLPPVVVVAACGVLGWYRG